MGIEVLPAAGRWDDFASFMVPRRPGGGGCVCVVYRNSSLDMPGRIAYMRTLCETEPGPGVLAYVDGEVAGWCSVAPKSSHRALVNSRTIPHIQDEDAWSVICFVVRPGFRRRGLMHHLLDGAVEHAHAMGAPALEGYPVDPGGKRIDQTSGYVGTVALFEAHGFVRVQQTAGRRGGSPRWLVRRDLLSSLWGKTWSITTSSSVRPKRCGRTSRGTPDTEPRADRARWRAVRHPGGAEAARRPRPARAAGRRACLGGRARLGGPAPEPQVWPTLRARDARGLIGFLVDAFGFEETVVYGEGDRVHHAELSWPEGGGIMLGAVRHRLRVPGFRRPRARGKSLVIRHLPG